MDVEIIDEDENPMLHRTDVRFQLTHEEATPSRLSVRDSLAAKLNKDAGEVVVRTLDTKYGMRKTVGYAKVYETAEDAKEVEQEHALERNKITADGVVEAAPEDGAGETDADDGADEEAAGDAEDEEADEPEGADAEVEESEGADAEDAGDEEADAEDTDAEDVDEEADADAEEAEAEAEEA